MKIALKDIKGLLPDRSQFQDWGGESYNFAIDCMSKRQIEIYECSECEGTGYIFDRFEKAKAIDKPCDKCTSGLIIRAVNQEK